ncbi:hypothetical protein EN962_00260 [Mesorhizobium sp. M7A.F.Ca.CA.001.09.2.1]|uniref:Uncharacterized protein n=1 Tax=Mesorhizobium ciceri TaxID=39645 RepID=A0AB38TAS0_9HYPH|nr:MULTISPECIES: hypothetical protein [Mesorhizobium]MDF3214809.1 hypothetical protein [Mesorhizobium ciceri]RUX78245.1 hypothetical protein EN990_02510 [Mesorhizobium sp. M7A.F.Ca.US.005.03.1.1]RUY18931.1 hypothetical protein EN991_02325 [Mesorhizobium sp. M7A.F.Ca.US.005.03.2.1]RUY32182.1 hypothetical protein EN979_00260 [Mesorhizobium sp. M7A.F.Ca.US.001.04.2.1]RUY43278.1 hypothetical protein EN978_09795 [Mesorhizobium sp. M7A.F.Ca.US.001.04.1.1]
MAKSITTEGRIFARQVGREIKRRELIGAVAISNGNEKEWWPAVKWLAGSLNLEGSPVKRVALLQAVGDRLKSIPEADKGAFVDITLFAGKRACEIMFTTLLADDHPMEALTGLETGVTIQCHYLKIGRSGTDVRLGVLVAHASAHALGRLRERARDDVEIKDGIGFLRVCGKAGLFAATETRLRKAEINIALNDDLIATGSTKVGGQGDLASSFFDCRTVLPRDACDGEQIAQATAFAEVLKGRATANEIPFLVRPNDFVLEKLKRFEDGS